MKEIFAGIFVLGFPLAIFILHKKFPGNKITPYFIPKLLADQKYPKAELRHAGTGYCVLALWIFSLICAATYAFLRSIERVPFLLAIFYFVFPILTAMALIIGISYLLSGLFGRGDEVKPKLESMAAVQSELLPKYIRKIKLYNTVNLSCPLLLMIAIPTEEALHIAENGYAILSNVVLLITFIMTLWRIRVYLVKAAKVMDMSPDKVLRSTLFNSLGIFFVWIHSFLIIRKFHRQNGSGEKN